MTATEWIAIASAAATVLSGGAAAVAKLLLTAVRELVAGQKEQTTQLSGALTELKLEIVSLRTHVDTLFDVTGPRRLLNGGDDTAITQIPKRKERS